MFCYFDQNFIEQCIAENKIWKIKKIIKKKKKRWGKYLIMPVLHDPEFNQHY